MLRKTSLHRKGERNGEPQREPCLSCTVHLSAPEKASKPFPRISIRDGFTGPTGNFNVSAPYTLRGPRERKSSRRIFVILHFSFGDRPLGGSLQHFHGVRHGCAVDLPTLQTPIEAL